MFIMNRINKWRLTEQINDIRVRNGLDSLLRVGFLDRIAYQHARYMAKNDKLGHDGFNARALVIREKKKSFDSKYVGENCGRCTGRKLDKNVVGSTVEGWMNSASHRGAILNTGYQRTGVGFFSEQGYIYIVQIFVG
jgi:uncharacterized protein YkwD